MKRNTVMFVLAIVITVNAVIMITRIGISEVVQYLDILSALTAIVGIIAIWYQLKKDKELNEAQFIFELNNNFYQNEAIMKVYEACNAVNLKLKESTSFTVADESIITQYFSFFGIINTFVEKGILNMELIDRTFAYRYFLVANHKEIQDLFLIKDAAYYRGNYSLYAHWFGYRQKKGLPIIFEENNLLVRNPSGFSPKIIRKTTK